MNHSRRDRGMVLIIVMLFLVLVTMLSISAFRSSTTNLRATNNMMVRQEAIAAAQAAIETTMSSQAEFELTPNAVARTENVDIDEDGTNDYAVTVMPAQTCSKIRWLLVSEFPRNAATGLPTEAWVKCDTGAGGHAVGSGSGGPGLIESDTSPVAVSGRSYCVDVLWNVGANIADARTGTTVQVNQGVSIPYSVGESKDRCDRTP